MAHSEVSTPESIEEIHHADPERTKDETCGETPESPRTMPSTAARDSTDSELGDPKSMYEACPYCAALFEVQDLIEHVTLCEDLSTLKAVEISLEGDTSFLPEIVGSDPTGETSVDDKDLCPKCRQEFTLLELINHAAECKEEGIRTSSDINDFPGDEVENFCDAEEPPTLDNTELAELCPTCRRVFPLFELVNHASECKQEEQLNKGGSEVEFSEEGLNAAADVDHAGSINNDNDVDIVKDTELCPKCRQEFPLLELVNHAAECTQEEPHGAAGSADVELHTKN